MTTATLDWRTLSDDGAHQRRRLYQRLSRPLLLEETGPPRSSAWLIRSIAVGIAGLIVLAAVTPVTETARAVGQVVPAGSINVIQHLEEGIIAEIAVAEGEIVAKGQLLMRLEDGSFRADLDQMRARAAALAYQAERLRAFVDGREAVFPADRGFADLMADQHVVLASQVLARDGQTEVIRARIEQQKARLDGLEGQRINYEKQIAVAEELLAMRAALLNKGLQSRVIYLETERDLSRAQGGLATVLAQIGETRATLLEEEKALAELHAKLRAQAVDEMGKVTAELAQVDETIKRLSGRVERLEIRAPVTGIVKGFKKRTIGAVIDRSEPLLEIVPVADTMIAELQISTQDVGRVRVGQPVRIEVTTYDPTRFGAVSGRLQAISASTFLDAQNEPYFRGIVGFDREHVGNDPERNVILPGMVVKADIVTGERSLLGYLLKPIRRGVDGAFHEG